MTNSRWEPVIVLFVASISFWVAWHFVAQFLV